ncbi:LacI family DNA-binding transcriptional regulator [Phytohabitans kaempferiae]|uniref:LacI family DNA-binding transcriptional regulator n=1 Tax=Phytohabitans kaempferiae TaxID=1620943 RepID=A0ABV6M501_9ACTN
MKPTLQTVADQVGVSRSTVSNAYSRPDQLSPELREKIFDAARELGYSGPNPTARSLRRGRAGAIGVLFTTALSSAFTDPYAVQFLRGLAEIAEDNRTGLLLVPLRDDDDGALEAVRNAAVDGFVVYCVPGWYQAMEAAWARGLPVVNSDRSGALYVGIDEVAASRAAGEHLMRLGHRRVAIIADYISPDRGTGEVIIKAPEELGSYVSRERLTGYRDAFAAAGLDWSHVTTISAAGNSREHGAAAAAYALDRAPRPTAVVATTDLLALGVLDALATRELRPGRDVSVIGFDDIPDAAQAHMTTVRQPALDRGRIAGRLLLDPPDDPARRRIVLPTELVVRASTGPAPTGSV